MLRKLEKTKEHQLYYTRDGRGPLPGCSSICKIGDDPGGLIHWAWKKGGAGEDYRSERDDAADAGDVGHGLSEAYLVGDILDLSDFSEEAQRLGTLSFEKFKKWWEYQEMVFMHSELQMVSEKYLFGGTLDIVGRDLEGNICLIDLKTTKSIRTSHGIQVAGGYGLAYNENFPEEPIDKVCILRLPKDGKDVEPLWLDPLNFTFYQRSFIANVESYYARETLNKVDPIAKSKRFWKPRKKKQELEPREASRNEATKVNTMAPAIEQSLL